jgi:hypothetical protein
MAFKEVTGGDVVYWINTDQIAYVRKAAAGSIIEFGAISDHRSLSLTGNAGLDFGSQQLEDVSIDRPAAYLKLT